VCRVACVCHLVCCALLLGSPRCLLTIHWLGATVGGANTPPCLLLPPCCCLQVVSWWGPTWREGTTDTQGVNTDQVLQAVVRVVEQHPAMKVALHMEPYPGE
jgi:hypothetical protein